MEPLESAAASMWPILEEIKPLTLTYSHLILSAIFPIYAGSQASLHCPSSAAKKDSCANGEPTSEGEMGSDEESIDEGEDEGTVKMEGMSPLDALLFPIMAALTLTGLYIIIEWFESASILNALLGWYLAGGFVYQNKYDIKSEGRLKVLPSPLPGALSRIPLPVYVRKALWNIQLFVRSKVVLKFSAGPSESAKVYIGMINLVAFVSAAVIVVSSNVVLKPWWLTNLMGFSFSYGSMQLVSPKTFATGTLLLSVLFFYDIYMVFKTPMMVTVAKSLDLPIKLVFPRPAPLDADPKDVHHAMLGLGDIVIPGLMIALALRFDHYMYYRRLQVHKPVEVVSKEDQGQPVGNKEENISLVRPQYHAPSTMSQKFWLSSWSSLLLPGRRQQVQRANGIITFPKPYFYASIKGYLSGLAATLVSMHAMRHAQPALLYLVPGVLLAIWLTGLFRGELKEMWEYTEEPSGEENREVKDESKPESQSVKSMFRGSDLEANEARALMGILRWLRLTVKREDVSKAKSHGSHTGTADQLTPKDGAKEEAEERIEESMQDKGNETNEAREKKRSPYPLSISIVWPSERRARTELGLMSKKQE